MADPAEGGTYTLVIELADARTIDVGALGRREFPARGYAYTGSALASGGFSRIERHEELAAGDRETRRWLVDYLLGTGDSDVDVVTRSPGRALECAVADRLQRSDCGPVPAFEASDCDCPTHLVFSARRDRLLGAVSGAHRRARERASAPT